MKKPAMITYDIGDKIRLNVDNRARRLTLSAVVERKPVDETISIEMSEEEAQELVDAIMASRTTPVATKQIAAPTFPVGARTPDPMPAAPPPPRPAPAGITNAEAAVQAMDSLMLIRRDGRYLRRDLPIATAGECNGSIQDARFFEDPAQAAATAKRLGAEVVLASEVIDYTIMIRDAVGELYFWRGNNLPLSNHVNQSVRVTGRANAEATLATVIVADGQTKFLMVATGNI